MSSRVRRYQSCRYFDTIRRQLKPINTYTNRWKSRSRREMRSYVSSKADGIGKTQALDSRGHCNIDFDLLIHARALLGQAVVARLGHFGSIGIRSALSPLSLLIQYPYSVSSSPPNQSKLTTSTVSAPPCLVNSASSLGKKQGNTGLSKPLKSKPVNLSNTDPTIGG
ncbi:uncharacterized protein BDW47DRAFT_38271 [Aspergillus candidus]|uniref:Uncharacterized protein n=1 Tax=Aspergillus candidus TaxID=41067 RepID=A0A2I2F9Z9_ASPCN|nr:hypothetical protein BDW47DRAFT_38271 [Aspergillus candidus]PLB37451.1 hypothetical protein BDW47DRAFT_38271 [Aspergillus candidus]